MSCKVLLWYDVEDYITQESDDALLALIEMMESKGIKGTFKFVGEKIRVVKQRGREDILDKLAGQDVGYHTDMHSEHPTISEYCEPLGFREGALEFEKRENSGLADLKKITGMSVSTYGQPGAAWAPQVFPVLKKWGIPTYVDANDMIDVDYKPFWFGGILTLTYIKGIMRMDLEPGGLDNAKAQFDQLAAEGEELISIYYHPCEFSTVEFWDAVNFSHGENTTREDWKRSKLRKPGEMGYYVAMLGDFIDYLLSKGCEFLTIAQLADSNCASTSEGNHLFDETDILTMADLWVEDVDYICYKEQYFSASELFSLFKHFLCDEQLTVELIYGPENDVKSESDIQCTVKDFKAALCVPLSEVMGLSQLPDFFVINGKTVNPVDMAYTLANIIKGKLAENDIVTIMKCNLAPQRHINTNVKWGEKWVIFPEDFTAANIIEMAKLQAWTLKPATIK